MPGNANQRLTTFFHIAFVQVDDFAFQKHFTAGNNKFKVNRHVSGGGEKKAIMLEQSHLLR